MGGDDQDGGVGVTQLIGAVYFTDNPALIGKALLKSKLLQGLTNNRAVSKESNPRIQCNTKFIAFWANILTDEDG